MSRTCTTTASEGTRVLSVLNVVATCATTVGPVVSNAALNKVASSGSVSVYGGPQWTHLRVFCPLVGVSTSSEPRVPTSRLRSEGVGGRGRGSSRVASVRRRVSAVATWCTCCRAVLHSGRPPLPSGRGSRTSTSSDARTGRNAASVGASSAANKAADSGSAVRRVPCESNVGSSCARLCRRGTTYAMLRGRRLSNGLCGVPRPKSQ